MLNLCVRCISKTLDTKLTPLSPISSRTTRTKWTTNYSKPFTILCPASIPAGQLRRTKIGQYCWPRCVYHFHGSNGMALTVLQPSVHVPQNQTLSVRQSPRTKGQPKSYYPSGDPPLGWQQDDPNDSDFVPDFETNAETPRQQPRDDQPPPTAEQRALGPPAGVKREKCTYIRLSKENAEKVARQWMDMPSTERRGFYFDPTLRYALRAFWGNVLEEPTEYAFCHHLEYLSIFELCHLYPHIVSSQGLVQTEWKNRLGLWKREHPQAVQQIEDNHLRRLCGLCLDAQEVRNTLPACGTLRAVPNTDAEQRIEKSYTHLSGRERPGVNVQAPLRLHERPVHVSQPSPTSTVGTSPAGSAQLDHRPSRDQGTVQSPSALPPTPSSTSTSPPQRQQVGTLDHQQRTLNTAARVSVTDPAVNVRS